MRFFRILRRELLVSGCVLLVLILLRPANFWPSFEKVAIAVGVLALLTLARALYHAKGIIDLLVVEESGDSIRSAEVTRSFFVSNAIEELRTALRHINQWLPMTRHELQRYTRICFNHCRGRYIGTDRNLPSRFVQVYPFYLTSQSERDTAPGDIRFLFVTKQELEADLVSHPEEVAQFVRTHNRDGIDLLIVNPTTIDKVAKDAQLPSAEFGIFAWRFIVYFKIPKEPKRYALLTEDIDDRSRRRLQTFFESILPQSESVFWRHNSLFFRQQDHDSAQHLLAKLVDTSNSQ